MKPRFKVGDIVWSYGFAHFTVEAVYTGEEGCTYDLREILSEELLKLTRPQIVHGVPEKYVHEVE